MKPHLICTYYLPDNQAMQHKHKISSLDSPFIRQMKENIATQNNVTCGFVSEFGEIWWRALLLLFICYVY